LSGQSEPSVWREWCRSAKGHLRATIRASIDHSHQERPHQGLNDTLIAPKITTIGRGSVRCRERLGGLLKFYEPRGHVAIGRLFAQDAVGRSNNRA
jgi:hypothetical protein